MNIKQVAEEKAILISEELKLFMNFDTEVFKDKYEWKIKFDTVAGLYTYTPSEKTVMGDVYRFISNYGLKLHEWGLINKIKEHKINI